MRHSTIYAAQFWLVSDHAVNVVRCVRRVVREHLWDVLHRGLGVALAGLWAVGNSVQRAGFPHLAKLRDHRSVATPDRQIRSGQPAIRQECRRRVGVDQVPRTGPTSHRLEHRIPSRVGLWLRDQVRPLVRGNVAKIRERVKQVRRREEVLAVVQASGGLPKRQKLEDLIEHEGLRLARQGGHRLDAHHLGELVVKLRPADSEKLMLLVPNSPD